MIEISEWIGFAFMPMSMKKRNLYQDQLAFDVFEVGKKSFYFIKAATK